MKKMMSIAAVTLMMAGSSAFACDSCGCTAKKAEKAKTECKACTKDKECEACTAKKAEKKAAASCCSSEK